MFGYKEVRGMVFVENLPKALEEQVNFLKLTLLSAKVVQGGVSFKRKPKDKGETGIKVFVPERFILYVITI